MIRFGSPSARVFALSFMVVSAVRAGAQAQTARATAGSGVVQGVVRDSIHHTALAGAFVLVDGLAQAALTGADGRYRIDSVPAGARRLIVSHPLLDTIGMMMRTPEFVVADGETTLMNLS